ncbi:MAG: proline--tRNA ligase [Synechococcus sp.]|nr:proline--tRNA ligase [Synechococcus sp.]
MRLSRLLLVTLRDDPAEAEIASHRLLLRAGYIRRVASGIYAYLPLLWRVLQKIEAIVREELNATGALETLLPQLQPADLWQRSGRWAGYTAGEGIMFHLQDRQGRALGLGPTHEEVITSLAADLLRSYRQLPVNLYQIQTKFRDEIRPRFGLMRGREFIMKDAYSFHATEGCLRHTYAAMDIAYRRIFERCGLRAVAVEADSGAIGGSASQEFMVTAEAGEDLILTSGDGRYAANQERAVSLPADALPLAAGLRHGGRGGELATPGQASIEDLCRAHSLDPSQLVKVLLLLARFEDGLRQPLLVSLRGDQQLNEVKLANAVSARLAAAHGALLGVEPLTADLVRQERLKLDLSGVPLGYLGPDLDDAVLADPGLIADDTDARAGSSGVAALQDAKPRLQRSFLRLFDPTAAALEVFVCGGNRRDCHRLGVSWDGLAIQPAADQVVDLRAAQPGDRCLHDPQQRLQAARGIEVGHIFQLGRKYSQALEARFTNEAGSEEPLWMGCYGIGISRLAQAAVEQNHDADGICWPWAIAPYGVIVVVANVQEKPQLQLAERLYAELQAAGQEVLLDDRPERAGVKFKDADLIGIPWRVVVGRGAAAGRVELICRRDGQRWELPAEELSATLQQQIG